MTVTKLWLCIVAVDVGLALWLGLWPIVGLLAFGVGMTWGAARMLGGGGV